jgi:hypothetical protein
MNYVVLAIVALALSSTSPAQPQTSPTVRIVAIGQLDGPRLRQLAPVSCGPYFTFAPTGQGSGIVYFGYRPSGDLDDDPTNTQVARFSTAAILARLCRDCAAPTAEWLVEEQSESMNLSISAQDLKLSPCLSKVKVKRR